MVRLQQGRRCGIQAAAAQIRYRACLLQRMACVSLHICHWETNAETKA
jgi:hypothetical protein